MQLTTDDGVRLHVQELGCGPPIVMLHGMFLGNMATWYLTAAPVLARRHRVILLDMRGHGLSDRARCGYDVARMTRDLEAVIEQLTREPVTLVGHSYGGVIALALALRRPELVRKLALVETPLPPSQLQEMDAYVGGGLDGGGLDRMLEAFPSVVREALVGGGRRGRRIAESIRFLWLESSLPDDVRRAEDVPDDQLAALACPLLAVYGSRSSCRPAGARLARLVPGARLVELPAGHYLPLEVPGLLTEALASFADG